MVLDSVKLRLDSQTEATARTRAMLVRRLRMKLKHGLVAVALLTGLVYFVYFRHSFEQKAALGSQTIQSSASKESFEASLDIPNDRVAAFVDAFDKLDRSAKVQNLEDYRTGYPLEDFASPGDKMDANPEHLVKITPGKNAGQEAHDGQGAKQKADILSEAQSPGASKSTEAGRLGNETNRQRLIAQMWGPGSQEAIESGISVENQTRKVASPQQPMAMPQQQQLAISQQKRVMMPRRPFIKVPEHIQRAMPKQPAAVMPQDQAFNPQQVVNPQHQVVNPQQQVVNPQQQVVNPQQQLVNPQQQFVNPQQQFVNPQLQAVNAQKQFVNPQQQVVNPQQQFVNPQQQVVNSQLQAVNPQQLFIPNQQQQQAGAQRRQLQKFDTPVQDAAKMFEDVRQKGLQHLQRLAARDDSRQKALPWQPPDHLARFNVQQGPAAPAAARADGNDGRAVAGWPAINPEAVDGVDAKVLQSVLARQADRDGVPQGWRQRGV